MGKNMDTVSNVLIAIGAIAIVLIEGNVGQVIGGLVSAGGISFGLSALVAWIFKMNAERKKLTFAIVAVLIASLALVGHIYGKSNSEVSVARKAGFIDEIQKIPEEPQSDASALVKTDKSAEFSEQNRNLYRNTKYLFRIKFPEGWEIKTGDGQNILVKAVKGNNSIIIGVREFVGTPQSSKATIDNAFTLEDFKTLMFAKIEEKYRGAKLIDYGETQIDNIPAYWIKLTSPYSVLGMNIVGTNLQYWLLYKNTFYFITASTDSSEFSAMEPVFKQSIATFVSENY